MLRRGFKSQCERRSTEIRKSLGLSADKPLSAFDLARNDAVTVWGADEIDGLEQSDLDQLMRIDPESWSAFTLRQDTYHLIVFNPAQNKPRLNSVVMHELAHIMLGHALVSAGLTKDGHLIPSNYDQEQEDEANWLGGTLLLPRPALLQIRHKNLSDEVAMSTFMVSKEMLKWRFRMTGVDYQIANARKKWSA